MAYLLSKLKYHTYFKTQFQIAFGSLWIHLLAAHSPKCMAYVTEVSNLVHVPLGGLLGRKILFTITTNIANTKQVLR